MKPIDTLRFDEFLLSEERKAAQEAELDKQAINEFSFASDASYELLVKGPALVRARPDNVPALTLEGLPEYVTTSEDEDDDVENAAEEAGNEAKGDSG